MKLFHRFFRRTMDEASCRSYSEGFTLADGTSFTMALEIMRYTLPHKKIVWYAQVYSQDLNQNPVGEWHATTDKKVIKSFVNTARFERGKLAFLPYRQRRRIMISWLKRALAA